MDKKPQAIKKQDYFSQKRKNQQYKAPAGEMKHVRAVLELLSAVMQDTRFIGSYNERVAEGGTESVSGGAIGGALAEKTPVFYGKYEKADSQNP